MTATRPRCYSYPPCTHVAHPVAAHLVAALAELRERHADMIRRLPADSLNGAPGLTPFSVAQITGHLGQTELFWIRTATGREPPADLAALFRQARDTAPCPVEADDLADACLAIGNASTQPALANRADMDAERIMGERTISIRGVLMHLIWHWTYHNGQCGLLGMQLGHDCDWTFDDRITGG